MIPPYTEGGERETEQKQEEKREKKLFCEARKPKLLKIHLEKRAL